MIDLQYIPPFFQNYIKYLDSGNIWELLENNRKETLEFLATIPEGKQHYRYGVKKWSIAEILQHLVDVERVFCYRALCFSRNDPSELHGFDQHDYIAESRAERIDFIELMGEWESVRIASQYFYRNLHTKQLKRIGRAGGVEFSVESIGLIMVGHTRHHVQIIKERYL